MLMLALAALFGASAALITRPLPFALLLTLVATAAAHGAVAMLTDLALANPPFSVIDRVLMALAGDTPMLGTVACGLLSCGLIGAWSAWGRRDEEARAAQLGERRAGPPERRTGARAGVNDRRSTVPDSLRL